MPRKWKHHGKPKIRAADALPTIRAFASAPAILGEDKETKLGTFEGTAYTGAQMRPQGWWQDVVIDLAGVEIPSQHRPALRQHDHEQIVGHTTAVTANKDGIHIKGVFSGQPEHVDKVRVPSRNGFQWQLSVGADPLVTEQIKEGAEAEVNGRTIKGPALISRKTRIGEISFVPLGADGDTSVSVAAQKGTAHMNQFANAIKALKAAGNVLAAKYSDDEIDKMSVDQAKSALKKCMAEEEEDAEAADKDADEDDAEAADEEDAEAADDDGDEEERSESSSGNRLKASKGKKVKSSKPNKKFFTAAAANFRKEMQKEAAKEAKRQTEVRAAAKGYETATIEAGGKRVNLLEHAIGEGWGVRDVKAALLDIVRAQRPGAGVGLPGGLGYTPGSPTLSDAVMEAALFHASRHQFKLEDDDFYYSPTPDGKGKMRRVAADIQADAQRELKARYTDQVQQTAHDLFKGRICGMHEVFGNYLQAHGYGERPDFKTEGGWRRILAAWDHFEPKHRIQAEGASNLSISNILANVLNKFALQGYLFVEMAWRDISGIRPVQDFKPTKSINLLGQAMFQKIGSTGELSNLNLGDQAFSNQAFPFGIIGTIPYTHLVNDDLGMLTGVPMKIGQGAGLALNDYFWSLWSSLQLATLTNPNGALAAAQSLNGDDGVSFWRTSSSQTAANKQAGKAYNANKTSGGGSALSSSSLQTVKALFDNQTDPNGNPLGFDGLQPILLHGPTNWRTVQELMGASGYVYGGASASLQPNYNPWQGFFKPVMSRYIENSNYGNSTTAWWMLFNPAALPVIETCFLNGIDTPQVLQAGPDFQFDRLGISIRGTMEFGVNQQNFRGGVFAAGA